MESETEASRLNYVTIGILILIVFTFLGLHHQRPLHKITDVVKEDKSIGTTEDYSVNHKTIEDIKDTEEKSDDDILCCKSSQVGEWLLQSHERNIEKIAKLLGLNENILGSLKRAYIDDPCQYKQVLKNYCLRERSKVLPAILAVTEVTYRLAPCFDDSAPSQKREKPHRLSQLTSPPTCRQPWDPQCQLTLPQPKEQSPNLVESAQGLRQRHGTWVVHSQRIATGPEVNELGARGQGVFPSCRASFGSPRQQLLPDPPGSDSKETTKLQLAFWSEHALGDDVAEVAAAEIGSSWLNHGLEIENPAPCGCSRHGPPSLPGETQTQLKEIDDAGMSIANFSTASTDSTTRSSALGGASLEAVVSNGCHHSSDEMLTDEAADLGIVLPSPPNEQQSQQTFDEQRANCLWLVGDPNH